MNSCSCGPDRYGRVKVTDHEKARLWKEVKRFRQIKEEESKKLKQQFSNAK